MRAATTVQFVRITVSKWREKGGREDDEKRKKNERKRHVLINFHFERVPAADNTNGAEKRRTRNAGCKSVDRQKFTNNFNEASP